MEKSRELAIKEELEIVDPVKDCVDCEKAIEEDKKYKMLEYYYEMKLQREIEHLCS